MLFFIIFYSETFAYQNRSIVLYICAYTARILYLPIDSCKIGIVNPHQNIDLGTYIWPEGAVYENDTLFLKKENC